MITRSMYQRGGRSFPSALAGGQVAFQNFRRPITVQNARDRAWRHERSWHSRNSGCGSANIPSTSTRRSLASSSSSSSIPYPRAAVAITVQCTVGHQHYYLLIQRGKEPDKGKWSLPGGSIKLGESTMDAAQRELSEETRFETTTTTTTILQTGNGPKTNDTRAATVQLSWYPGGAFTTSDAIFRTSSSRSSSNEEEGNDNSNSNSNSNSKKIEFHYLIAQCFAKVVVPDQNNSNSSSSSESAPPKVYPADDADDAKWWTLEEIMDQRGKTISGGVDAVVVRAESLQDQGLLVPKGHG